MSWKRPVSISISEVMLCGLTRESLLLSTLDPCTSSRIFLWLDLPNHHPIGRCTPSSKKGIDRNKFSDMKTSLEGWIDQADALGPVQVGSVHTVQPGPPQHIIQEVCGSVHLDRPKRSTWTVSAHHPIGWYERSSKTKEIDYVKRWIGTLDRSIVPLWTHPDDPRNRSHLWFKWVHMSIGAVWHAQETKLSFGVISGVHLQLFILGVNSHPIYAGMYSKNCVSKVGHVRRTRIGLWI